MKLCRVKSSVLVGVLGAMVGCKTTSNSDLAATGGSLEICNQLNKEANENKRTKLILGTLSSRLSPSKSGALKSVADASAWVVSANVTNTDVETTYAMMGGEEGTAAYREQNAQKLAEYNQSFLASGMVGVDADVLNEQVNSVLKEVESASAIARATQDSAEKAQLAETAKGLATLARDLKAATVKANVTTPTDVDPLMLNALSLVMLTSPESATELTGGKAIGQFVSEVGRNQTNNLGMSAAKANMAVTCAYVGGCKVSLNEIASHVGGDQAIAKELTSFRVAGFASNGSTRTAMNRIRSSQPELLTNLIPEVARYVEAQEKGQTVELKPLEQRLTVEGAIPKYTQRAGATHAIHHGRGIRSNGREVLEMTPVRKTNVPAVRR